jgi:hypothetical protein
LLRGDLAYKVTAGPDGTHIIHLLSTPGSPNSLGGASPDDNYGWNRYVNCYVWYTYYDVSGASQDEIDACLLENKNDILLTPDQVPLSKMRYELMNEPTKNTIRQLLVAESMITIALIRGYASGEIKIPEAEMKLDYAQLMELGKTKKETVFNELKERLESMLPWNYLKNMSDMTDSLQNILNKKPLGFYVI